jgi:hypothetical protein
MHVVLKSASCLIPDRLWQPSDKDVTRNGDITTHVATTPLIPGSTEQFPVHSSNSLVFTAPAKSRAFRRIVQLAGVTFLILSFILVAVLLAIPPQDNRYRTKSKSTKISQIVNFSPRFSGVSTKFKAPATDLQMKKQHSVKNNKDNVLKYFIPK